MKNILTLYRTLWLILCFSFPATASAEKITLSEKATISILTCAPGNELYSLFGHTGIRVTDPTNRIDVVFNYGTFDFDTQGFYLKFARGLLPYQLSISNYYGPYGFLSAYDKQKRSIYSQTLNLDSIQKQELMNLLLENYEPQNRSYLYNFLYDNCSTRVRDIIEKSLDNEITWKTREQDKSFWNLLDEYLQRSPWTQWGIHTILGSPANADATNREQMFLPDYLMYALDSAYYPDGTPLAQPIEILYRAPEQDHSTPWFLSPFFVFFIGMGVLIFIYQKARRTRLLGSLSVLFFAVTGLIGCLIIFLGFFTKHPTTFPNFNILWANPLNLIAAFFIARKHTPPLIGDYLLIYLGFLIIGLISWFFLTPAVLPSTLFIIIWMIYLTIYTRYLRPRMKFS
ncbi:Lnb N-terminal periplasmic domain-containing protein [Gabonibacter chumensis]|uniref:Lnb N-terminal periplasmic domain-containing protein n=1 Tax=Gabonibacter chumensis TaxID=2972474 RepID=UPI0025728749|nr:DUF4105 domain-containing protein [Gabonibacter chumensis]MCR9012148.1 DUF4105 domain-containing protein [Gabonibacter chumensis]